MRGLGSIRNRLTVWYFLTVALILSCFGAGAWLAMRASVMEVVNHDLQARVSDVGDFLATQVSVGPNELTDELKEQAQLGLGGTLVQVSNGDGAILYRSRLLESSGVMAPPRPAADAVNHFTDVAWNHSYLRFASRTVDIAGRRFSIQVAEPMKEFDESLATFRTGLLVLSPLFLLLATLGGYWISGRALAPVDRITQSARSITISNLSARLPASRANDELQRLTDTLNEMLERLESQVRRMSEFTANASHELRAPLTLIQTAAEFSLRRERSHEELLDAIRKILREATRTSGMVNELLVLARADAGAEPSRLKRVDLAASGRAAVDRAVTLALPKGLTVTAEIPSQPVFAEADEQALARLWLILLDNAVKYTNEGGSVRFEMNTLGDTAEIVVSDTGVGISAEELPRAFERFWRADKVRSRDSGGAGLGLSIAKWIAESHHASIRITSEPGQGTRVAVRFPLSAQSAAPAVLSAV